MPDYDIRVGDCISVMESMPENSIDALVTDPPAGISFMGKAWDRHNRYEPRTYRACELYSMLVGLLDMEPWEAGFVAFTVDWASQALRVLKPGAHGLVWALPRTSDLTGIGLRAAGFEIRDNVYHLFSTGFPKGVNLGGGFNTALKPAAEEWILVRKPFDNTVTTNVWQYGTGRINIDACRVPVDDGAILGGRWPANVVHDGSDEVVSLFPVTPPGKRAHRGAAINGNIFSAPKYESTLRGHDDSGGSAARFFYMAKASKRDRDEGLEEHNQHPTVKATALMQWLVRLVTPIGGTVLDPFMGSGSTGKACMMEDFNFTGIERDEEYFNIAKARIRAARLPILNA